MQRLFVSILVEFLAACTGDRGLTGPEGQSGAPGPTGPVGPQGKPGTILNWADVIDESQIDEALYGIGIEVDGEYYLIGGGFAAYSGPPRRDLDQCPRYHSAPGVDGRGG